MRTAQDDSDAAGGRLAADQRIEASFVQGQLWFGSMPDARKGQDPRRDPNLFSH